MKLPFYRRFRAPQEEECLHACLAGELTSERTAPELALAMQNLLGTPHFLFTPSGSLALELALLAGGIGAGDEVILPSFNFPSAANAVLRTGARPVLCDIDAHTQNISCADAAARMTKRTRAVIAVHYAGVSADMDALSRLCVDANCLLIEDAAQGIGAAWGEKPLGTLGDFGALSFHATKNITCGEGGLLAVAPRFWDAAQMCAMHGTDRRRMLNGEQDRYAWQCVGTCALLGALGQSVLQAQLPQVKMVTQQRLAIAAAYDAVLTQTGMQEKLQRMKIPKKARYNGHIYYVRLRDANERTCVQQALAAQGMETRTHYVPLHLAPAGRALGYVQGDLPESERCGETLLRLPIHTQMTAEDAQRLALAIAEILR